MSITVQSFPSQVSFSASPNTITFLCDQFSETSGQVAINSFDFLFSLNNGEKLNFVYGTTEITLNVVNVPDQSGYQVPSGLISAAELLPYFQGNYQLSKDFEISHINQSKILFTAKKESSEFDFEINSTPKFSIKNEVKGSPLRVKTNYGIYFRLWCEKPDYSGFEVIYENTSPLLFGTNGTIQIPAGDKLHDFLSYEVSKFLPDVPDSEFLLCKKSCRRYFFEYAESYGDIAQVQRIFRSDIYTVIHGGFSTIGQTSTSILDLLRPDTQANDRFLKQGPIEIETRKDQPQYLYFLNTRSTAQAILKCRYYFTDGSVSTITLASLEVLSRRKYGFNVTFDHIYVPNDYPVKTVKKYEIWLSNFEGSPISESRFYLLDLEYRPQVRYFLNWSSWGTLDSRMFHGRGSLEFDLVQSEAKRIYKDSQDKVFAASIIYDLEVQSKFKVTTGFLKDKSQLLFNRDFFVSPLKYLVSNGEWLPIKVTSKTIPEFEDGNHLYAQAFEYEYLFQDNAYTEGDIELPPAPADRPLGLVYFGPALTRPLTAEDIISLPNRQSADIYLFPLYTGLNRIFIVATPSLKGIGNVYNQTADENLTSEYIAVPMQIDGLAYNVAIMEMAVAYSINNDHIITLKNE